MYSCKLPRSCLFSVNWICCEFILVFAIHFVLTGNAWCCYVERQQENWLFLSVKEKFSQVSFELVVDTGKFGNSFKYTASSTCNSSCLLQNEVIRLCVVSRIYMRHYLRENELFIILLRHLRKKSKSLLNAAAWGLGLLAWPLECHDVSVDRQRMTTWRDSGCHFDRSEVSKFQCHWRFLKASTTTSNQS